MGDGVSDGNRAGDGRGILINNDHQPGVGDRIKPIVASASYQPGVRQTICQAESCSNHQTKGHQTGEASQDLQAGEEQACAQAQAEEERCDRPIKSSKIQGGSHRQVLGLI